jgi:riboflavin kinase/FMN adenylyltransferase
VSSERKYEILATLGIWCVVEQRFDAEFAALPCGKFVTFLKKKFDSLVGLCVGPDFRFGHGRLGEVAVLRDLCDESGAILRVVEEFCVGGKRVSSSKIRKLIAADDFHAANRLLGSELFPSCVEN